MITEPRHLPQERDYRCVDQFCWFPRRVFDYTKYTVTRTDNVGVALTEDSYKDVVCWMWLCWAKVWQIYLTVEKRNTFTEEWQGRYHKVKKWWTYSQYPKGWPHATHGSRQAQRKRAGQLLTESVTTENLPKK